MKKLTLIIFFIVSIISIFGCINMYTEKQSKALPETEVNAASSFELETKNTQQITTEESKLASENKTVITKKQANNKENNQQILTNDEAIETADSILNNIKSNQSVDLSAEKELIKYLKETNNEAVFQLIIEHIKNTNSGNKDDDRLIEYSLSLLAAIDSPRASEIFFGFVKEDNWENSAAIYTVNKSISRLARNENYTGLIEQTFAQTNDESPFLNELASGIAHNAKAEQVDYLINYIDSDSKNKSLASSQAMIKISSEPLVPHILSYTSDNSSKNVQTAALNSLANMGQYEAASALIKWSSEQSSTAVDEVATLFEIALRRSPSTKRAIEKEINDLSFNSSQIQERIIQMADINQ